MLSLEISKTLASVDNMINAVRHDAPVDVLGSLLVIRDQLDRLEEAFEESERG